MAQQKHIINKQILEIHLSPTADAFAVQQQLSVLCRNQLTTVMDRVFCQVNEASLPLQIEQLTLDLGKVSLENFETVFTKKLQEELVEYKQTEEVSKRQKNNNTEEETPLRAVVYYLKTGVLPWWAKQGNKTDFQEQLGQLLQKPNTTFIRLLKELQWNTKHLERFVYASAERQLLASFQLISELSSRDILKFKDSIQSKIQKKYTIEDKKIQRSFWKTAFLKHHIASTDRLFERECTHHLLLDLGIDHKENKIQRHIQYVYEIKSLVASCKQMFPKNPIWKAFFKQLSTVVTNPFFDQLPAQVLKQSIQMLQDLHSIQEQTLQKIDTNSLLKPLATSLQGLQKELERIKAQPQSMVTDQFSLDFEDTDFISIQNAGLVLFWPFLVRFFENLQLIANKTFIDETAKHMAVYALQYLCEGEDQEWFEGALPLNKLLCGLEVDEVVSPIELSEEEIAIADDLLTAVIERGPKWKNLSPEGFRASYLCRPGSLRTRDGHWLLQVQRETHDITLEKLPWGFHTIKLPWMQEIIVVEWL
ncbi:contractile injection system tape measure protein [Aquimarina gracilis]|uniref:Contractile injection system tape measure protein n=1 Tax=Aquimarina gracilis TaxID=874422 RepID=A0ABU5ZPL1_9FLAO|nr:contractile injection system tape measure protein [Aquimarina gracilis]MEB3344046.1 contractile injection system tape measure protein [Aquimarina gracilis]